MDACDLIAGRWAPIGGEGIRSVNPARPSETVWSGAPTVEHVAPAVEAARAALPAWVAMGLERRCEILRAYQAICKERAEEMASLITDETGKALWEGKAEAGLLSAKVDITLDDGPLGALARVRGQEVEMTPTRAGRTSFRPHGVMAVIGPFNFPAHLPNGHIVPALAMGNTIVFKPSDKAPAVGQLLASWFEEALQAAGAPAGVMNVVHGAGDVASNLVSHDGIDGVLFTGSWPVGRKILEANLDRPSRIVALEMGGNNPAVVMESADLRQAVIECVRCAFVTTGQRCTCTRRIILHRPIADRFISALAKAASTLVVGDPRAEHPVFMGPIISDDSRDAVLRFQSALASAGGEVIVPSTAPEHPDNAYLVTPGVVRVDRFSADGEDPSADAGCDGEVFGPFVRVSVVDTFEQALEQANATRFGLASSIFSREASEIDAFVANARAGCVNVNTGTAGASGKLPFGGLGLSGNHRPAGSFSLDYCAYPVAGLIESGDASTVAPGMLFEDGWL